MSLRWVEWAEDFLRKAMFISLALLLLYPLLPALLFENPILRRLSFSEGTPLSQMAIFWLQRLDAGAQMGLGPFIIRGLALAVVALPGVFPCFELPVPRRVWMPLVTFHILSALSAAFSSHPYDALLESLDAFLVSGVALRAAQTLDGTIVSRWLSIFPVIVLCHLPSLFVQFCFMPATDGQMRGAFYHPNMLSSYLLMAAPIILLRALAADAPSPNSSIWKHWRRGAYLLLFSFVLASVILSGSRQAVLALTLIFSLSVFLSPALAQERISTSGLVLTGARASALTVFCVAGWAGAVKAESGLGAWLFGMGYLITLLWKSRQMNQWRPWQLLASLVLAGLVVLAAQAPHGRGAGKEARVDVLGRISGIVQQKDATSVSARVAFWQGAWGEFSDHPLLGVGPAGFHRYYPQYQNDARWFSKFPHSLQLGVLCENGWPAFVALGLASLMSFGLALGRLTQDSPLTRHHRASAVLAVMSLEFVSAFDVQWQFPVFQASLGFLLGCCWTFEMAAPGPQTLQDPASPWLIRPQVIVNQTLCAFLLILQLLNIRSAEAEYYHQVSKLAVAQQRNKEAVLLSQEAIYKNPWQGEYCHQLGLAVLNGELDDKGQQLLLWAAKRACHLDAHRAVHWDLLAKAYLSGQKLDDAISAARRAIALDGINYPSFYSSMGQFRSHKGEEQSARLLLEGATIRFPNELLTTLFDFRADSVKKQLAGVYAQLGELAQPQDHPAESKVLFSQALELDGNSTSARLGEGVCLYELGQFKEAIPHLEIIRDLHPDMAIVQGMLAECYRRQGRLKEAQESAKRFQTLKDKQNGK